MSRSEDALHFDFCNSDMKSSLILKMDLKTYKLLEFYPSEFSRK